MSGVTHLRSRHWIEYGVTAILLGISVVSLWVAIGTEDANRRMVAASSWPFLQIQLNDVDDQGRPHIVFAVANSGVGPAKIHSFQLFWKGKPYIDARIYLHDCCGLDIAAYIRAKQSGNYIPIVTGSVKGQVVRAGEVRMVVSLLLGRDNAALWHALDAQRANTSFRACYCSVFDECWETTLETLDPKPVEKCPTVTNNFPS